MNKPGLPHAQKYPVPGLVYLAGPVDGVTVGEAQGWRYEASLRLADHGLSVFSPAHGFSVRALDEKVCTAVRSINEEAVRRCHGMLAYVGGSSFGTPIECWQATTFCKPVFCFGCTYPSIYAHSFACWVPHMDEALYFLGQWQEQRAAG